MTEFKRYDSNAEFRQVGVYLAKEPAVHEGDKSKLVRLTFVCDSRNEKHQQIWVEANVNDFQSGLAEYLKKGDRLDEIKGFPFMRSYTAQDGTERTSFGLQRAQIAVSPELMTKLKERGFTPGVKATAEEKKGKKSPPKKDTSKPKREVVEIPDDEDDSSPFDEDSAE